MLSPKDTTSNLASFFHLYKRGKKASYTPEFLFTNIKSNSKFTFNGKNKNDLYNYETFMSEPACKIELRYQSDSRKTLFEITCHCSFLSSLFARNVNFAFDIIFVAKNHDCRKLFSPRQNFLPLL